MALPLRQPDAPASGRFGGLFDGAPPRPAPGALADVPGAAALFELIHWGVQGDIYSYGETVERRAGPRGVVRGREVILAGSYDYLGLLGHPAIEEAAIAAIRRHGTGTGGVRPLTGTVALHRELEAAIAGVKEAEAALTFSSGYLANLAAIASLCGPRDRVLLDAKAHRSLRDACVLAQVPHHAVPHNDVAALREALAREPERRTLVVVDGCYSMDGDLAPLPDLVAAVRAHGAFLLVDEAHALGTLGARGRGAHEHFGLPASAVDLWTGSLSKAIPANGGYVAGSHEVLALVQHLAAAFCFSAALAPPSAAAALAALEVIAREPERVARAQAMASRLREGLAGQGWDTAGSESVVVPAVVGDARAAWRTSRRLLDEGGVLAPAVAFPVVPRGSARLRLCASAAWDDTDCDRVVEALARAREWEW